MLLTNTQGPRLRKAFAKNSSANIRLLKTQLHKIKQSGGFLGRLLGPLLKTELSLIGKLIKPLAKSFLIPLRLTAAASETDEVINKRMFRFGTTTLTISNEKINDIMKIVTPFEEDGLLIKGVSITTKNEAKEQKAGFLGILLCTFDVILLGNLLAGKGTIRAGKGARAKSQGIGTIRAGENF